MKQETKYSEHIPHLHKSTTMRFSTISQAVFVALLGASNKIESSLVRWTGMNIEDASLIVIVIGAVVGCIGVSGTAKGYVDSKNKLPVNRR